MNAVRTIMCLGLVGGVILTAGCNDEMKEKYMALQDEYSMLQDDYSAQADELSMLRAERDRCHEDLMAARGEADDLRNREPIVVEKTPDGWTDVPGGSMIAIEGEVLFDSGKAVIRTSAKSTIRRIVDTIRSEYPDREIIVRGHTDNQPIRKSKWKDNWELSSQRSLAVVREMVKDGISPSNIEASGCGEFRPVLANSTNSNMQKNRRVEIFAMEPVAQTASMD